jgi:hypothetical protein
LTQRLDELVFVWPRLDDFDQLRLCQPNIVRKTVAQSSDRLDET